MSEKVNLTNENRNNRKKWRQIGAIAGSTLALTGISGAAAYKFLGPQSNFAGAPALPAAESPKLPIAVNKLPITINGHKTSFDEIFKRADNLGREFKVFDHPFEDRGGDSQVIKRIRERYSNQFITSIQMANGMKLNIYAEEEGGNKLIVNPQGMVDMFNYVISAIPLAPDSPYKNKAMSFLKKARNHELNNILINLFMSTTPGSCVSTNEDKFVRDPGNGGPKTLCDSLGYFVDASNTKKPKFYNLPLVVARIFDTGINSKLKHSGSAQGVMHEFIHGIVAVGNYVQEYNYDLEHSQFVYPLAAIAGGNYEFAVNNGEAQPAFDFTKL